jgi:hypothetical protein
MAVAFMIGTNAAFATEIKAPWVSKAIYTGSGSVTIKTVPFFVNYGEGQSDVYVKVFAAKGHINENIEKNYSNMGFELAGQATVKTSDSSSYELQGINVEGLKGSGEFSFYVTVNVAGQVESGASNLVYANVLSAAPANGKVGVELLYKDDLNLISPSIAEIKNIHAGEVALIINPLQTRNYALNPRDVFFRVYRANGAETDLKKFALIGEPLKYKFADSCIYQMEGVKVSNLQAGKYSFYITVSELYGEETAPSNIANIEVKNSTSNSAAPKAEFMAKTDISLLTPEISELKKLSESSVALLISPLKSIRYYDVPKTINFKVYSKLVNSTEDFKLLTTAQYGFADSGRYQIRGIMIDGLAKGAYAFYVKASEAGIETETDASNTVYVDLNGSANSNSLSSKIIGDKDLKTLSAEEETPIAAFAQIAPNPASEYLRVNFNATQSSRYSMKVISMTGAEIYNENGDASTGENIRNINLNKLTSGAYSLILTLGEKSIAMPFSVIK